MWIKEIAWNPWVQGVGWVAALEWLNTVWSNFHSLYDASIWDVIGSVSGAVDAWLEMTWFNSAIATNEIFGNIALAGSGLWAMALSNKVLKDLWLNSGEWNTFWMKNLARYGLNTAATLSAISAWSVALPYIVWWSIAYWAWKHGWTASKETLKWIYSWVWWVAKNIITSPYAWYKAIKNSKWKWNFKINPQTN